MSTTVEEIDALIDQLETIRERVVKEEKEKEKEKKVDPDLLKVREIVGDAYTARIATIYGHHPKSAKADEYKAGKHDEMFAMRAALAAYKAGRLKGYAEAFDGTRKAYKR